MPVKLYLIPNALTQDAYAQPMLPEHAACIKALRLFFVEEPKSARALLKKINPDFPLAEATYIALNEHSTIKDVQAELVKAGNQDMAIISEAGYPCVADPGAELVRLAHQQGMDIIPLIGASSIILALASSGLNGQNFAFNGYLPKDKEQRLQRIKALEQRAAKEGQTQIMMEAPYRSQSFLEDLLNACQPQTLLCIACNISGPTQMIKTAPISTWKKTPIILEKQPTLFLINS